MSLLPVVAGCLCAGLGVMTLVPGHSWALSRLGGPPRQGLRRRSHSWRLLAAASVGAAVALALGNAPRLAAAGVGAGGLALVVRRWAQRRRAKLARRERQRLTIELCDALAAELRSGAPVSWAFGHVCEGRSELAAVASAATSGGDVPGALRQWSVAPGARGARAIAAGWEVSAQSGAGLAVVLDRIGASLRSEEDARAEVLSALGPPRATGKLLAVLPAFGLGLGASLGAHPLRFLLGTTPGICCLALGLGLALTGVWWVERLADAAEI
ncbi:MAG TPA: type II secretion system F family protein [Nocardioidaceae bacterium]|nr:type II secretion system F family protein [Nocardioidaceae bacterium]